MSGLLLIQGAMDVETDWLISRLEEAERLEIGGFSFWRGRVGPLALAVSRTEVGMVHAAAATALGIQAFRPALVLDQGTAGAHREDLHVGDIVVGRTCVDIQSAVTPHRGPGEGMCPEEWSLWDFQQDTPPVVYPGDPAWAARFEAAFSPTGRVTGGRLGSGDLFSREHDRIHWLRERAGEDCEDMESAAVYRVCVQAGTPCLGLRIVSNNELTGEPYRREVGVDLQKFVLGVLMDWAEGVG